jgi:hypothetical protein
MQANGHWIHNRGLQQSSTLLRKLLMLPHFPVFSMHEPTSPIGIGVAC